MKKILIVDDEKDMRHLLKANFELKGYKKQPNNSKQQGQPLKCEKLIKGVILRVYLYGKTV